ncbi:MAG: dihydroorotase [Lachnospiraceae bacterium]|nr:dihydroorotase [Lachnospiraceae bacterium]
MNILIRKGRILNPADNEDFTGDILIKEDKIVSVGQNISEEDCNIIDASGCFVMPGFIDLHVHLRDPGLEYKETLATGAKAAAHGGFTTICPMPNTKPPTDTPEKIKDIVKRAASESPINILPIGSVTLGMKGEEITDIEGIKKEGACGISEDGKSVMKSDIYRKAMRIAAKSGVTVMAHCEDISLVEGGVINVGKKADELGLKGISNAVEDIIAARDILLAKETGAKLHLCHCSTKDSVKMVELAKEDGLSVTAEACPHHFTLCDEDIKENDGNYKMNPPLRSREDMEALKEGLKNGIIDVISTDHAPHSKEEKAGGFETAPFGIVGLETAAALTMTELVDKGYLTPLQMAEKMSYNPAKVIGIDKGIIAEGKTADIVIFNPDEEYLINVNEFESKGKNTPFNGRKVKGKVKYTICGGNIVYGN